MLMLTVLEAQPADWIPFKLQHSCHLKTYVFGTAEEKLLKTVGAKSHKIDSRVPLQFAHLSRSALQCSGEPETEYFTDKWVKYIYCNWRETKKWLSEFTQWVKWCVVEVKAKRQMEKTLPVPTPAQLVIIALLWKPPHPWSYASG